MTTADALRRKRPIYVGKYLVHAGLILAAAVMVLPLIWMVLTSFKGLQEVYRIPLVLWPEAWRWENYVAVWSALPFSRFYVNSVSVALIVVVGQLITSTLSGFIFARIRFRGRELLFSVYLGSMMLPDYLLLIPSFLILRWLGLLDTYGALTLPFLAGPFGAFLMRQQFLSLPKELEEAAAVDGCSPFATLVRILVPAVRPGLMALAIYIFLFSWNAFLWPLVTVSQVEVLTLPVGLAFFQSEEATNWPVLMAGATLAALPVLFLVGRAQKLIVHLPADDHKEVYS